MVSTLRPWDPHMWKPIVGLSLLTLAAAQTGQPGVVPSLPTTVDGIPGVTGHEGPLLFFLGTLVTTLINLYIKSRDRQWSIEERERARKWDTEDRERLAREQAENTRVAAEELKRTAEAKARETAETARQVAEHMMRLQYEHHQATVQKIDANTQMNEQALSAANAINEKILHVKDLVATVATTGGRRAADQARQELSVIETAVAEHHGEQGKP